jgi:hypothetical protein
VLKARAATTDSLEFSSFSPSSTGRREGASGAESSLPGGAREGEPQSFVQARSFTAAELLDERGGVEGRLERAKLLGVGSGLRVVSRQRMRGCEPGPAPRIEGDCLALMCHEAGGFRQRSVGADFLLDKGLEFSGRHDHRVDAQRGKCLLHLGALQRLEGLVV